MNCQDLSRLLDAQEMDRLPAASRQAAEAHLADCGTCARHHQLHRHLVAMRIPDLPAATINRWRSVAAGEAGTGHPQRYRLFVIAGACAALAAAAAMLAMRLDLGAATTSQTPDALGLAQAGEPPDRAATRSATDPEPALASSTIPIAAASLAALPLLPPPEADSDGEPRPDGNKSLSEAVRRHPELVDGPPVEGTFVVTMTMRPDGEVIESQAALATPGRMTQVYADLEPTRPRDGAFVRSDLSFGTADTLPDGRSPRTDVMLRVTLVPATYDLTRSNAVVDRIVRTRYGALLLPTTSRHVNQLTVLLDDQGRIESEKIEQVPRGGAQPATDRTESLRREALRQQLDRASPAEAEAIAAALVAERIAATLGIDVGGIGRIGRLSVEHSSIAKVEDEKGIRRNVRQTEDFRVAYAWRRGAAEKAARMYQGSTLLPARREFDYAAALVIVEHLVPDAFTPHSTGAAMPVVLLDTIGRVIGVVHLAVDPARSLEAPSIFQELKRRVPGFAASGVSLRLASEQLTNRYGDTAMIMFAWSDMGR